MQNLKIYNSESYKEFSFGDDYLTICSSISSVEQVVFASGEYFIAPMVWRQQEENNLFINGDLYMLNKHDYSEFCSETLSAHHLFAGKIMEPEKYSTGRKLETKLEYKFKIKMLNKKLYWAKQFLHCIYEHLATRESEEKMLINHYNVRMMIAEVVTKLQTAEVLLHNTIGAKQFNLISAEIIDAIKVLARLAGGRAVLQGSVVSMLWLFEMFQRVYFTQGAQHEC